MAGAGGFEPPHGGIKIRCLTAWRRPNATREGCIKRSPRSRNPKRKIPAIEIPVTDQLNRKTLASWGPRRSNAAFPRRGSSRSVAQPGSAPRSGRGGRRFKSFRSDQFPGILNPKAFHSSVRYRSTHSTTVSWGMGVSKASSYPSRLVPIILAG